MVRLAVWIVCSAVILAAVSGCGPNKPVTTAGPQRVELNVAAALGLKDALLDIQREYEAKNPNVKLVFNLAASGVLATQIEQGAPADVFLSAGVKEMDELQEKQLINSASRRNLLGNDLVLIINKSSPLSLTSFKDLTQSAVKKFGIGEPVTVPAGQYGKEVLQNEGIWDEVKDKAVFTKDVRTILTYVETGNVEAGIVFSTVAATSDKVKVVAAAPPGTHEPIVFLGAVLANSKSSVAAADFLNYLAGPEGAKVFRRYGFSIIESSK